MGTYNKLTRGVVPSCGVPTLCMAVDGMPVFLTQSQIIPFCVGFHEPFRVPGAPVHRLVSNPSRAIPFLGSEWFRTALAVFGLQNSGGAVEDATWVYLVLFIVSGLRRTKCFAKPHQGFRNLGTKSTLHTLRFWSCR